MLSPPAFLLDTSWGDLAQSLHTPFPSAPWSHSVCPVHHSSLHGVIWRRRRTGAQAACTYHSLLPPAPTVCLVHLPASAPSGVHLLQVQGKQPCL